MQKQPVLHREGGGPGKEVNRQRAERMRGWRQRQEEADGGRLLEAGDGAVPDPTIAGSTRLTFCPCPWLLVPRQLETWALSVIQRVTRLWVSRWPWGAGPGSRLGVPSIRLGSEQVAAWALWPWGPLTASVFLRHPPLGPTGAQSCPPHPAHSPCGPRAPCPPASSDLSFFGRKAGQFPIGCHT